jgi:hypothetical protein
MRQDVCVYPVSYRETPAGTPRYGLPSARKGLRTCQGLTSPAVSGIVVWCDELFHGPALAMVTIGVQTLRP